MHTLPFRLATLLFLTLLTTACVQTIPTKSSTEPAPQLLLESETNKTTEEFQAKPIDEPPSIDQLQPKYSHENLWERIRENYQLDYEQNERITAQLNWFKKHQSYLDRVSDRGKRYLYFIMEQIEVLNMPAELALLPIVESAFDPFAYSHGRASGVWQFIPSTGHIYKLKQDWWYDGRRDIRRSTIAALKFLSGLSREFDGDWMLALAAYNSGAGTVRKAIRKNKKKGLPTDFWALSLPKETRDYVPKLLGLATLVKDPNSYGVTLSHISNSPYFAVIDTGSQIDLSQAAQMAGIELEEIYKLNPQYNQWATSPNGPHEILVPIESKSLIEENLKHLPVEQRIKWQRYKVQSGDSLISIANKHHTTPDALKQVNPINGSTIRIGDTLLIPTAINKQGNYTFSAKNRLNKKQNQAKGVKGSTRITHIVEDGDSLWELAKKHKVSTGSIASWNGMAPRDPIHPGQKLIIWSKDQNKINNREVIRKIRYRVRNGDSLHRIADKFNVKVKDIERWNQLKKSKYIKPGLELTLYVDVTQSN